MYLFLNQLAGTNRYLWNNCLADLQKQYEKIEKTKHSYFGSRDQVINAINKG